MILNTFFDKIYVINLKESIDRNIHIKNEFQKKGITNYEFFEAEHYNNSEVKELLNSNKVISFPPCFRCLKNRCRCENNFLTKYQIANWLSFIKLFNKILVDENDFVLICEDDIVFTKQSTFIFNELLNEKNFKKYNINKNNPILIKMGSAYNVNTHDLYMKPEFIKNYSLSNPCFAVNKEMIKVFLYNLKIIDYHSDIYFHKKIPINFSNVQMLVMNPMPIYELSFIEGKKQFNSLIRPSNEIRKKEYYDFLFVTMNKLLEYIPIEYVNKYKLNISNKSIQFNGTINHFYNLNNKYHDKYYFKNKIFIYDNYNDDLSIIKNDIKLDNSYLMKIIEIVINKYNIEVENNYEDIIINFKKIYPKIISYFEELNFLIININDNNIFNKYKTIEKYQNIKFNILNNFI